MSKKSYLSLKASRPKHGISLSRKTPGVTSGINQLKGTMASATNSVSFAIPKLKPKMAIPKPPPGAFKPKPGMPTPTTPRNDDNYNKLKSKAVHGGGTIPEHLKPAADALMEKFETSNRRRNYRKLKNNL